MGEDKSVCCPFLQVLGCADTKEHKHPACGKTGLAVTNFRASTICISDGEWKNCIAWEEPEEV